MPTTTPYGSWESPITSDSISKSSSSLDDVIVDPVTSEIYHIEKRPSENGRSVLIHTEKDADLFDQNWNCRTGVQEYGGAAAKAYNGVVYFSNFSDGRVYAIKNGEKPEPITPESDVHRFADFAIHPIENRFIVSILEDHTKPAPAEVVTTLCVIDSETKIVHHLTSGADFYAAPSFSPDGAHLVWQQWNFPDMPWDGGLLSVASFSLANGTPAVTGPIHIAGKYKEISAGYPSWISKDVILYSSDESGYQNPWVYSISAKKATPVLKKPLQEEFNGPAWTLGDSDNASLDTEGKSVLFTASRDGRSVLYLISVHSGAIEELTCPYVAIRSVRRITDDNVVFIGSKADEAAEIVIVSINPYAKPNFSPRKRVTSASEPPVQKEYLSKPQSLSIDVEGKSVHAIYFPPTNPNFVAPVGEKPPCVVNVHGGPTGNDDQSLKMLVQFFTSRGFGWLSVNYGGSSGYGREYVDRLNKLWGVVDVRDCTLATAALGKPPYSLIDGARTAIRGGSSGGYTTLAALCVYPEAFAAGTSLYGISDLKKLEDFTHKFESKYMFKLLGGSSEEVPDVYKERSPLYNAGKIKSPLLIEQGGIDAVVPPEQAEAIVKIIQENHGDVEYVVFPDEGHGWRKAENIKTALEKELAFYRRIFKLNT